MRAKERRTIENCILNCILNNQRLKLEKVGLEVEETECEEEEEEEGEEGEERNGREQDLYRSP